MNLTFLNPFFLIGLAAGIIPILIHRLTPQKAIHRKFSAVRLLLKSQQLITRPRRIRHLLLLALRVLAVMSLALLMARPVLTRSGLLASGEGGAKVLIFDNSLSMSYRDEQGERHELAKRAAREIIESVRGQILVVPMASVEKQADQAGGLVWLNPAEALKKVEALPLSYGRGDPTSALDHAFRSLKDLKSDKEILIVSDTARGDWDRFDLSRLGTVGSDASIAFLRIGRPSRDPNFAIREVRLAEGEMVVGTPVRLETTVVNFSDQQGSVLVQLFLSGVKVDQKSVELKREEERKVSFELFLDKPGWVDGEVRLSEDRLPLDNTFFFPLNVRDKVKVLVVDGDPRPSLKASESYYLVNALHPGGVEGSPFLPRVVTEKELANVDLKPFDALFVLNVTRPQASALAAFVDAGKPVFLFLGDHVVPEEYNSLPLFPWRLGEVRGEGAQGAGRPEKIAQIDKTHDALKPFYEEPNQRRGEGLKSATFYRYVKVDGAGRSLLSLGNNDPLLVESQMGRGKLYLFASSADLDWNDLALKAAYLPLIHGLLKESLGLSKDALPPPTPFGAPFPEKGLSKQVAGPSQGPGIYSFPTASGEMRRAVNVPIEESDLKKMTEDDIKKKFGSMDVKTVEYREGGLGGVRAAKMDLWPYVLLFLLVVLGIEMGIANRVPRSKT